jgi:hypothetical protein
MLVLEMLWKSILLISAAFSFEAQGMSSLSDGGYTNSMDIESLQRELCMGIPMHVGECQPLDGQDVKTSVSE